MTTLGNVPAGEQLLVTITYIGELKHDGGADGIRFTLPTVISPRYGQVEADQHGSNVSAGRITITVDIKMAEDSPIQELRSPSHPIAVTLGKSSISKSQSSHPSKASASLSLAASTLERDFVLEVVHHNSGRSKAFLEAHPTISGQRALMTTLVPKNTYDQSKPEVIIAADQSGSMQGNRTKTLVSALRVLLKSLPVGIKFNICLFGSSHYFLFPKSQIYSEATLEEALKLLGRLNGDYGGTEILGAVKAAIESRDQQQDLSIILATDGDLRHQQAVFDYINQSVSTSEKALRVFALGIGDQVSSALIEGVAKAGNGFAQSVGEEEKYEAKVIGMLKGALTPDSGTYTLEIQYRKDREEDDFVHVERVTDSLRITGLEEDGSTKEDNWAEVEDPTKVAFGEESEDSAMPDADDGQARFHHLPAAHVPKLLQSPQRIPPLYPFVRTTAYILISPDASQGAVKSVVLKGNSPDIPFEMEIPIEIVEHTGGMIHQQAAKKAISELEEGRGWFLHTKDENGILIKDKYPAHFTSMIEREAVRLGVQYQIAGKYTSFVAVDSSGNEAPISQITPSSCDMGDTLKDTPGALDICYKLQDHISVTITKFIHEYKFSAVALVSHCGTIKVLKAALDGDNEQSVAIMKSLRGVVPVPEIYYSGRLDGWFYILMEHITVGVLLSEYCDEPQDEFYSDVKTCVEKIRKHKMDHKDFRIMDSYYRECSGGKTTYRTTADFINNRLTKDCISATEIPECEVVLSHSDMVPRNIFISHDGKSVVSIIDWEMAGYYPDFYEFFKYLHEFKYNNVTPSTFTDEWLDIFWTETVPLVMSIEDAIHDEYCNATSLQQA